MPGTNKKAVAVISVLGTVAALALGLMENASELALHSDPSIRLDQILDDRARGIARSSGLTLLAMALASVFFVQSERRVNTIKWIVLGQLVAVSIASSVVLFEFVAKFAIR